MGDESEVPALVLVWLTQDLDRARERFLAIDPGSDGRRLVLPSVGIRLEEAAIKGDRLVIGEAAGADDARPPVAGPGGPVLVALGWATVDIARAIAEFGREVDGPATPDELLGASAQRLAVREGGLRLILLEPTTEGPIAAALARHGEGPVALYLTGVADPPAGPGENVASAVGPGRLAWPTRAGPFVVLVA